MRGYDSGSGRPAVYVFEETVCYYWIFKFNLNCVNMHACRDAAVKAAMSQSHFIQVVAHVQ